MMKNFLFEATTRFTYALIWFSDRFFAFPVALLMWLQQTARVSVASVGYFFMKRIDETRCKMVEAESEADPIPFEMKTKYLLRSRDRSQSKVRIAPELRRRVTFKYLNLMDPDYRIGPGMDIILCRNVIIYFDRTVQLQVLERLNRCLKTGGFLFMGHSETLNGFDLPLTQISANIYHKKN